MLPQNAFTYDFYNKYEDLASDRLSITDLRIAISLALFMFAAGIFSIGLFYPFMVYERAGIKAESGDFDGAIRDYGRIPYYRDSAELATETLYKKGRALLRDGRNEEAAEIYLTLSETGYRDSKRLLKESDHRTALKYLESRNYELAAGMFSALGDYRDSHTRYLEAIYYLIIEEYRKGDIKESLKKLGILTDAGYFEYHPLEAPDRERALELVKTTSVNLYADFDAPNSEWNYYTGSGCVYKITPDFVYFLSAGHVLNTLKGSSCRLTFYDGSRTDVVCDPVFPDDTRSDLSMFRVRTEDIPLEVLMTLKEINFDPEYYGLLKEGEDAFLYSAYWYGKETLVTDTEFEGFDPSYLTDGYYDDDNYLAFRRVSREGQSGCPVFDLNGRCLCLSSGYYYRKLDEEVIYTIDCYSRLEGAEELYEKLYRNG